MSYIGTNKVGKMYLGGTAIGKAYLGDNLVFGTSSGQSEDDYISNGLVFHLDCEDATTSKWIDRKGGIEFAMNNVSIGSDGGVIFSGSSYGYYSENLNFPSSSSTIEVVVYPSANAAGVVFFTNAAGMVAFGLGDRITTKSGNGNYRSTYIWESTGPFRKFTFAVAGNSLAVRDKSHPTASGTDSWFLKNKGTYIGTRSTSQNFFKGSIYQIRIYNRVLTEDEILHNQDIDIQKYNI